MTAIIDQKTVAHQLPLPHPQNELEVDALRIRDALISIDGILAAKANAADVSAEFAGLIDQAPAALNTLKELAAALANNDDYAGFIASEISRIDAAILSKESALYALVRKNRKKVLFGFDF